MTVNDILQIFLSKVENCTCSTYKTRKEGRGLREAQNTKFLFGDCKVHSQV